MWCTVFINIHVFSPDQQQKPLQYVGKVLQGFVLSSIPLKKAKLAEPVLVPQHFRAHHKFSGSGSVGTGMKHNAMTRALVLGEKPIVTQGKLPKLGGSEFVLRLFVFGWKFSYSYKWYFKTLTIYSLLIQIDFTLHSMPSFKIISLQGDGSYIRTVNANVGLC